MFRLCYGSGMKKIRVIFCLPVCVYVQKCIMCLSIIYKFYAELNNNCTQKHSTNTATLAGLPLPQHRLKGHYSNRTEAYSALTIDY